MANITTQPRTWPLSSQESFKPILTSKPLAYCYGFHALCCSSDCPTAVEDLALLLIHLHRVDYNMTRRRHQQRAKQKWNASDLAKGYSKHQLAVDGQEFDDFYYRHSTLGNTTAEIDALMRYAF